MARNEYFEAMPNKYLRGSINIGWFNMFIWAQPDTKTTPNGLKYGQDQLNNPTVGVAEFVAADAWIK